MKKYLSETGCHIIVALAAILAATALLSGCQSSSFEKLTHNADGTVDEVHVSIWSHMFKRDVDSFQLKRTGEGQFDLALNGYKSDVSEQLPATVLQAFQGLAAIGRIAGAAINPAVATIPLSNEGASPATVASVVQAQGAADSQRIAAKAAGKAQVASAKAAKASAGTASGDATDASSDCPDGDCGYEE